MVRLVRLIAGAAAAPAGLGLCLASMAGFAQPASSAAWLGQSRRLLVQGPVHLLGPPLGNQPLVTRVPRFQIRPELEKGGEVASGGDGAGWATEHRKGSASNPTDERRTAPLVLSLCRLQSRPPWPRPRPSRLFDLGAGPFQRASLMSVASLQGCCGPGRLWFAEQRRSGGQRRQRRTHHCELCLVFPRKSTCAQAPGCIAPSWGVSD